MDERLVVDVVVVVVAAVVEVDVRHRLIWRHSQKLPKQLQYLHGLSGELTDVCPKRQLPFCIDGGPTTQNTGDKNILHSLIFIIILALHMQLSLPWLFMLLFRRMKKLILSWESIEISNTAMIKHLLTFIFISQIKIFLWL